MLHDLKTTRSKKVRRGRGNASNRGTYSGRGVKGQKARSGGSIRPGFEGGRTPLARLLPKKRGLRNLPTTYAAPVNVKDLSAFKAGEIVSLTSLKKKGVVSKTTKNVKILSEGDIKVALKIELPAQNVSAKAKEKIEKAGGHIRPEVEEKSEKPEKSTKEGKAALGTKKTK